MPLRAAKPRPTLDAAAFERMVAGHEGFLAGRPGGRLLPRQITARNMRCDLRTLSDADFTGSDLSGSSFVGADLQRASLYCTLLLGCDFRGARLQRSDLRGATLSGSKFEGAVLDEADMRAAILCVADPLVGLRRIAGAEFRDARLDRARLDEVEAYAVDFTGCSLRGARFRNANLKHANFSGANLADVDFSGARIEGIELKGAILTGVDLSRLGLPPARLAGCVLDPTPEAIARRDALAAEIDASEHWVRSNGRDGRPARLDGADLRPLDELLAGRMMPGLSARKVVAVGVRLAGSQLAGANFEGADLRGADLRGCDLRGVSFQGARLGHAQFRDAIMAPLPLAGGRARPITLEGAELAGTGLTWKADLARSTN